MGGLKSADALPFDVVVLFFHWVVSPGDLAALALVSKTWNDAVTARLYSCVVYTLDLARQAGRIRSPFSVILQRPQYAPHVKHLVIRSVPAFNGRPDAKFEQELMRCMDLFGNLVTFTCTAPSILPSIVNRVSLNKPRLAELKIDASINRSEMELLLRIKTLKAVAFDNPTRVALDRFPALVKANAEQLQSISITNASDLDVPHLKTILATVPDIRGLQILNCLNITHPELLHTIARTAPSTGSSLTSLTLTVYTATVAPDTRWPQLLHLRHLTIFVRQCNRDLFGDTIKSVLSCAKQAALESLTLRHAEEVRMPDAVLDAVVRQQNGTLRRMNVLNFNMSDRQVERICREMRELTQFAFYMGMSIESIASAVSKAKKLTTLIDTQSGNGHAGGKNSVTFRDVHKIFTKSGGILRTVKVTSRTYTATWTAATSKDKKADLKVTMVRDKFPFIYEFDADTGKVKEVPGLRSVRREYSQ